MKRPSAWLLLPIVLAWFWPASLGARATSPVVDTHALPLVGWLADGLREGRIPEWNSLDGIGTPALALSEIAPYYLPNQIAYRLLDPAQAWTLLLVLHILAAAVFGRLCARGFGMGQWASLLAGVVFAGQGFFMTHADLGWAASTACWLPLATWAAWRWLETGSPQSLLGLSAVLAFQFTAGHFQLAFMTTVTLAALSVGHLWVTRSAWPTAVTRIGGTAIALLFAATLSAAQLIPSAELAQIGDTRGRNDVFRGSHSTPPWHLVAGHLAPTLVHADPLWLASSWSPWQASPTETLGYVGLITIGLTLLGLSTWKTDHRIRLWGGLLFLALVLSLGRHTPLFELSDRLPGFSWFSSPGRWSVVAGLWWSLLAGRGLEQLDSPRLAHWCRIFSLSTTLTLVVTTWALVSTASNTEAFYQRPGQAAHATLIRAGYTPDDLATRPLTPATELARLLATGLAPPVLALATIAFLGLAGWPTRTLRTRPEWVLLLVALDLGATATLLRPIGFTWESYAPGRSSPLLKRLARSPGTRVVGPLGRLPMTVGLASFDNHSIPDTTLAWQNRKHAGSLTGYDWPTDWWPVPSPSRRDTLGVHLAQRPSRLSESDLALMKWTGSRHLVVAPFSPQPQPTQTLRSTGPIEDSHLVRLRHGPLLASIPNAAQYTTWALAPKLTAARGWFIPFDPSAPEPGTDPSLERQLAPIRRDTAAPQPVTISSDHGERIGLSFHCDEPGIVVLTDQAYPGWTVSRALNGANPTPARIETAWGQWRMVRIPRAGDWTVQFKFAPASSRLGRSISLGAIVAWVVLVGFHWWTRQDKGEPIHSRDTPELQSGGQHPPEPHRTR